MLFLNFTCTEPFDFETTGLESILVVEGNITDEVNTQEISLSRAHESGQGPIAESEAMVTVEDNQGNSFQFEELANTGKYRSLVDFGAVSGREYTLKIKTVSGESYTSVSVLLPPTADIKELKAERTTKSGIDGVAIQVSSQGNNGEPGFFRYTYEETYRIVSFYITTRELIIVSENPPELELVEKTREERICYNTINSNEILVASAQDLNENVVNDFQLRFIDRLSRLVTSRYSIQVTQFAQTREANSYYQNLKEFSSLENLFSQTQPGFIPSNVSSDTNVDEKVLGFFEVTAVSRARIFFNFQDVFGNSSRFLPDCDILEPTPTGSDLFSIIRIGSFKYAGETDSGAPLVAPASCVDCTILGSNVVPDFWID